MPDHIFEATYETCGEAVAELERRERSAAGLGGTLANVVAVFDPSVVSLLVMAREDFVRRYRRPAERALVAFADPPDAMRVVMLDGEGGGRSLLLADLKKVLEVLELESMG